MVQQLVPQSLTTNGAGDFPPESLSAHCAHLRAFCVAKRRQIADLRSQIAEQTQRLIQFDGDDVLEDLQQAVNHARLERDQQAEEAARHQKEAAELAQTVSDLERQIESLRRDPSANSGESAGAGLGDEERQEFEDLQRRYDMSLEDLKVERARCRELEDKLLRGSNATLS